MHAGADAPQRIVLSALSDDGPGNRQRAHAVGATEANRSELRLRQICVVRRIYHPDLDPLDESGTERFGAPVLWLGFGSDWALRHDGHRFRAGGDYDRIADPG